MNWQTIVYGGALGGIAVGIMTACWARVKTLLWTCISLLVADVNLKDEVTGRAVLSYLIANYKRIGFERRVYGGSHEYTRDGKYGMVPFEFFGNKTMLFHKGFRFIIFGWPKMDGQNQTNYFTTPNKTASMVFLRGTIDVDKIVAEACKERNQISWNTSKGSNNRRFFIRYIPDPTSKDISQRYSPGSSIAWYQEGVYRLLSHSVGQLGRSSAGNGKALDNLIFPNHVKQVIREVQIWRNNRNWYHERAIPWKRGLVLFGKPGTGKTMLVRALAEDEDMPLFVFSLAELMNGDLQKSWQEMQAHVPCIALCEDIDAVFHGRSNVVGQVNAVAVGPAAAVSNNADSGGDTSSTDLIKSGRLTFDCLLNCIDGPQKQEGIFTILTTNDISKIDHALGLPRVLPDGTVEFISTRPGRIDKAIELKCMEFEDKMLMANRILSDCPQGYKLIKEFLDKYPELEETPAQFQERCAQIALAHFWADQATAEGDDSMKNMVITEMRQRLLGVDHTRDSEEEAA